MPRPTVIAPRHGELVGDAPDRRVEILSDADALHATWSRFAAGRDGADLHVHRRHSDLFYVLEGELTLRLGPTGEEVQVRSGTLARIPPLVVHGFRNASAADVRYLNLHAPGRGFADYMRSLRDGRPIVYDQEEPPPDGGRPVAEAVLGGAEPLTDGPGRQGVQLLADVEEIAIARLRIEPRDPSAAAHLHEHHVESLYVLEGELVLMTGAGELRAGAGAWVHVAAGVAHSLAAAGPQPLRLLDLHTPGCGFGAFLRALGEAGDEPLAAARAGFDQQPAA